MSGDELAQLKDDLAEIKEPFSLVEFDDDVDDTKGNDTRQECVCNAASVLLCGCWLMWNSYQYDQGLMVQRN